MALNINIGILGHIDSGKTSLAKALSDIASTAAFDKSPQSQTRGITLDLGFSSFSIPTPQHMKDGCNYEMVQYTLVDCPGHASLIKTIIGGAQIIDMMLLVIDATKGIQTQTAECIVIGEITCKKLMIIVNKIDLFEEDKRNKSIQKVIKKLKSALAATSFTNAPVVCVSSNPKNLIGIKETIDEIAKFSSIPKRSKNGNFLFSVDHCFLIKGKGTVMTGTVLKGSVAINDTIDIPNINESKKVKSMEMFKKPVQSAMQGDRLGICVTQFNAKLMERGLICTPGFAKCAYCVIINLNRIKYFKGSINTKGKYHLTLGHYTVMGTITLFQTKELEFDLNAEFEFITNIEEDYKEKSQFVLIEFEQPVIIVDNSIVIGSKLDMDVNISSCRIAFWGNILQYSTDKDYKTTLLPKLKIFKLKTKQGVLDRMIDDNVIIVKNMFKKTTNLQDFVNFKVELSTGEIGKIESTFGKSGKVKVYVENGLEETTKKSIKNKKNDLNDDDGDKDAMNEGEIKTKNCIRLKLSFKKYIFDVNKRIYQ